MSGDLPMQSEYVGSGPVSRAWLGAKGSNLGLQGQNLPSYR